MSAMGELRRVSPYQPAIEPVQKLGPGDNTMGGHSLHLDVFLNEPGQAQALNNPDCTICGLSLGSPAEGAVRGARASDIVKDGSSGEDFRATAGLVSSPTQVRVDKTKQHAQAADLCGDLETWAWSEAYHVESPDLLLWSLAAVNSTNKKLIRDLTYRANDLAKSFTSPQMAMTWKALADLAETPVPAAVDELVKQVREMAVTFTPRHAKQTVASMRKCGVYDGLAFAALTRLAETAE